MRIARPFIIALLVFGACYLVFDLTRPSFPVVRELENREGKTVEGVIQGKMDGVLFFDRSPSGERFEIREDSLALGDRVFAMRLRESMPPPVEKREEEVVVDRYVQVRQEAISELREKAQVITDEIASNTLNEVLHQNRIEQLRGIEEEIRSLQLAIKTYNYRMKKD